jgi:sortase (surface protein transpeptidase)
LGTVGAVLLVAGVIAVVIAVRAQKSAPQPPDSAATPVKVIPSHGSTGPGATTGTGTRPAPSASNQPTTRGPILSRSVPVRLRIPAINVDSTLKKIGLNDDGEIATPPLVRDSHAYWLTVSPTPGQLGPATIIGHVDSAAYGPGVFFELGDMRQRDKIYLTRADGTVATFEVERVVEYSKADFPTHKVYGNIDHAGLRLITCGGTFNRAVGSYESNIVVYAALVSAHHS